MFPASVIMEDLLPHSLPIQPVPFPQGFAHVGQRGGMGAALYGGHGQDDGLPQPGGTLGRREGLGGGKVGAQADGSHVGGGVVVVLRRGPTADEGTEGAEAVAVVVGVQRAEGGAEAPAQVGEAHKRAVRLLGSRPLPAVGRVAEVERVAVAQAAGFVRRGAHGLSAF